VSSCNQSNAICASQSEAAVIPVSQIPTPSEVGCPDSTLYNVRPLQDLQDGTTMPTGTVLCLPKKLGAQTATISSLTSIDTITAKDVVAVIVAKSPCNNSGGNSGFMLAHVESFGTPGSGNPIVFGGTVCVKSGV
jgi:hypothetical protein